MDDSQRRTMRIEILVVHRERLGLSQRALAARIGWSQSRLCRIESGKQPLTVSDLGVLSGALGLTVEDRLALLDSSRPNGTASSHAA